MPPLRTRLRVYAYEVLKTFALFSVLPVVPLSRALRDEAKPELYTYSINIIQYFAMPLVGLVKLAIALALALGAATLWGDAAGAALAVIAYLALSGGMHLDGFADTMDALFAASAKPAAEVLRDPHVGALGVVYLLIYLALYALFAGLAVDAWLAAPGPVLTAAVASVAVAPRVFCHGLVMASFGRDFQNDRLTRVTPPYPWWRGGRPVNLAGVAWWAMLALAILAVSGGSPAVLGLLAAGALGQLALAGYALKQRILPTLGFINGDVLGFTICLGELIHWLLVALIFVRA